MNLFEYKVRLFPSNWGLLPYVLLAILLGIICGLFFPVWLSRIFITFNGVFGQFLGFIIPLIILGLIAPGIAELGNDAGKMLIMTVLLAYGFTLFAGFFAYGAGTLLYPYILHPVSSLSVFGASEELAPYFIIEMDPLLDVITSLIFSFVLGLGISFTGAQTLRRVMFDFRAIIYKVISKVIIPLLPVYIFGIFLNMTISGQVAVMLAAFAKLIILLFVLTLIMLLIQFCIAGLMAKRNPLKMLKIMLPAYFTALGTSSSAATIPVTYKQVQELGVREGVAGFTVPLCSSIHMSGSAIKITACALAIILMTGGHIGFFQFSGFIFMLGVSIVAGPGVPGGAIMASLGILQKMLGFSEPMLGLMIALYISMDSFGTACNVMGDGAISVIIDQLYPERKY